MNDMTTSNAGLRDVGDAQRLPYQSAGAECAREANGLRGESARLSRVDRDRLRPEQLTLVDLDPQQIAAVVQSVPGGATNVQSIYPLSPLQEGLLFHHLLNENDDTYVLSTLLELQSYAQVGRLIEALQRVMDRHDVLRTAILWEKFSQPVQVVYRQAMLPVDEFVLDRARGSLEQLKAKMRPEGQVFDLRQAPLMRLSVGPDPHSTRWFALLQVHHVVCDYQSLKGVVAEAMTYLEASEHRLPPAAQFQEYVAYELNQLRARAKDAEEFFRSKLGDIDEPTAPFGLINVHRDSSEIEEVQHVLDSALAMQVRAQARRAGVTAARLFHAAWGLVVAKTSSRDEVVFGTVVLAARQRGLQARRMLGMSVNTLPLSLRLKGLTAKQFVEQTHVELTEVLAHEYAPLTLSQRCSAIAGTAPLFTTLLNYRHNAINAEAEQDRTDEVRVLAIGEAWSNYPIAVTIDDLGQDFALTVQVDKRIGPQRIVDFLSTALASLATALEHSLDTPVLRLPVLPSYEWQQVVSGFNATQAEYPSNRLIHQLFEEQVARTPDARAVICGTAELSYSQLNSRANQLAHLLIACGVRPDDRVAIYVERSADFVVGLIGTLKAGGAYVPIDVAYPQERVAYMLHDSAPVAVLTREHLRDSLPKDSRIISFDDGQLSGLPENDPGSRLLALEPHHLAYVIYTSGSTGTPKGVMVSHRNLANLIQWHCGTFGVTEGSRCSCVAAVGFDAAVWEIWPPLSVGATLLMTSPQASSDVDALLTWWRGQALDTSFLPTPIAEFAFGQKILSPGLGTLLIGGDRLSQRPAQLPFALVNNYGPTEATVVATSGVIRDTDTVLHIGHPIANTQIYILDSHEQVVPVGVAGEIWIGGAGVARGYLNRPELTTERFVPDPFSNDPDARMYRTGDLARWRADGTIEYLGRNDHQLKIRGMRIEPGEIEARLVSHSEVGEAVVIAREDSHGDRHLVAYVTAKDSCAPKKPDADSLRRHLKTVLPDHMVPNAFVVLERFPLTSNGKLDRQALPAPESGAYSSRRYEPPRDELEQLLADIWQTLLGASRVGRLDNFFELGGHSLLATRLTSRVRELLEVQLPVRSLFEAPTLEQFCARVRVESQGHAEQEAVHMQSLMLDLRLQIEEIQDDEVHRRIAELEKELGLLG